MSDRIKLAEAMGWSREGHDFGQDTWLKDNVIAFAPDSQRTKEDEIPDPFTDANDDYAVLEWMGNHDLICRFNDELTDHKFTYKLGDYARAALKVLE